MKAGGMGTKRKSNNKTYARFSRLTKHPEFVKVLSEAGSRPSGYMLEVVAQHHLDRDILHLTSIRTV
jgi:hypothetical protein